MSNLRAREPLERARQIFLERPADAKKANASATAVWRDGLRCDISGPAGEKASSDMPGPMGGEGSAPNPGWLLRASMAACTATAIAMQATRLGVELKSLEVSVESESDARGFVGIDGVSTAMSAMRMAIRIGADGVSELRLREMAERGNAISAVGATLRERPPVALEIEVV
jgi:uncharacterized OsmC-like protein